MRTSPSPSTAILQRFIAGANAQYRAAGLGRYQMRVGTDGVVRPMYPSAPARRRPTSAALQDARAGAALRITSRRATGSGGFDIAWQPVAGARSYGVYQDGTLLGHVPRPTFAGSVTSGMAGTLSFDAVRADGTRTARSAPVRVLGLRGGLVRFVTPDAAAAG